MTEYIITDEFAAELRSVVGTEIREAIESGLTEYSDKLRVLLDQLTARPVAETSAAPKPELSRGWQVAVSYETPNGASPYVTDRSVVVGAVAELVGADQGSNSPTIEEIDKMVEEIDAEYGVYMIPLTLAHVTSIATGTTEFLANHPMGGLIYITLPEA
jgi:hypothetical protein